MSKYNRQPVVRIAEEYDVARRNHRYQLDAKARGAYIRDFDLYHRQDKKETLLNIVATVFVAATYFMIGAAWAVIHLHP